MVDPFPSWEIWYRENRRRLANQGLYLDGGEPGRQAPAEFHRASTKILICRLSTYDDVLPSISHRILYWAARQTPGVYVDLAFFPPARDAVFLKNNGVPLWLASGCKMPPGAFDIVAVSISVPQEAFNLPAALRDSGLKLSHVERMTDPSHPLVILGGHAAGSVPFVHNMVDAVCLGDGITWLQEFLSRFHPSKADFLRTLAVEVKGSYVPSFYRHIHENGAVKEIAPVEPDIPFPVRHRVDDQDAWIHGYDGAYIPFSEEDTEETLPLAFGCVHRCRFCQTGWMRKGIDASDSDKLRQAAVRLKAAMVASDLNLLASDACSVTALADIVAELRRIFPRVSVKSLAVSSLARNRNALNWIEKREFTFGVEGISLRLRAYLGKPIGADTLIRLMRDLAESRPRQMKLFFIATGLEADEDIAELDSLLRKIKIEAPACRLIASFMPLFRAPFTPLQFDQLRELPPDLCRQIERVTKSAGAEFRWSASPAEIRLMNLLCRAGRAAAPVITKLSLQNGIRYYNSLPDSALRDAEGILNSGLERAHRESSVLPWDDIEAGARRSTLWHSFQKAKLDFGKPAQIIVAKTVIAAGGRGPESTTPATFQTLNFWIQIAQSDAHHPDSNIARGFLRGLFASNPGAAKVYGGNPQIQHPPGASGLALLTAQFDGTVDSPVAVGISPAFDKLVFLGELETSSIRKMVAQLITGKIAFQTERRGNERWSVIRKGYRNRTGLLALCERSSAPGLVLCGSPAKYMTGFDSRVTAVFEKNGASLRLLKSTGESQIPEFLMKPDFFKTQDGHDSAQPSPAETGLSL
jgi:hypothetical protein